ncbi:lipoyl(octanoyl) transferase LipB [Candidatus Uabimicrobium amorphum]|uniref:Octanoyltransferase n=1 Tax=Uabimicrobium amorphum TaxID=2596890 RepID=A0A5S9ISL9_UABAM|nr:hypothetical protein [Candidatus Uabimicrobium amorphum]BBM85905.1 Octanoyltransferase [Candidatus Uabimicrobium amorphum]
MKKLNVMDLGLGNYTQVLRLQKEIMEKRARGEVEDTLILVEHPTVITLGVKANEQSIKVTKEYLAENGIEVHEILRGGAAFLHSPGQIVGYPIFLLEANERRAYLETIQQMMMDLTEEHKIPAVLHPNKDYIGVWYEVESGAYKKIGAVGMRFVNRNDQYVTLHGFALNVNNDSSIVEKLIFMCGCPSETCISWKEITQKTFDLSQIKENIIHKLAKDLHYNTVYTNKKNNHH